MMIPPHGYHRTIDCRFNWLFEKKCYGRTFLAHLFETHIVDHVIVIDSRRWLSLMYDFSDLYRIMLSSQALFHCTGPGANKVKIVDLYEVLRYQRKYETSNGTKREIIPLPRGSSPFT